MAPIRTCTTLLAVALALVFPLGTAAGAPAAERQARKGLALSPFGKKALASLNATRRTHGLRPLRPSAKLAKAAVKHARSMGRGGYFSHSSRGGGTPRSRILQYVRASLTGEVILWQSPGITPRQAIQRWLASSSHRALLLHRGFREVGIAAVRVRNAPGVYGGLDVTIVVADFAAR